MTTIDRGSKQVFTGKATTVRTTFFVFKPPVPVATADEEFAAAIELELLTPPNTVLLEMAARCTPPDIPEEDDEEHRW
jgi:hypothetical protein